MNRVILRLLSAALAALLLLAGVMPAATFARAEALLQASAVQIAIGWVGESGEAMSVLAQVMGDGTERSYWATLPEAAFMQPVMVQIINTLQPAWSYQTTDAAGNTFAADGMHPMTLLNTGMAADPALGCVFSAMNEESGDAGGREEASEWKHSVASMMLTAMSFSPVLRTLC